MAVKKFGYARVSTKDQNLARQIEILPFFRCLLSNCRKRQGSVFATSQNYFPTFSDSFSLCFLPVNTRLTRFTFSDRYSIRKKGAESNKFISGTSKCTKAAYDKALGRDPHQIHRSPRHSLPAMAGTSDRQFPLPHCPRILPDAVNFQNHSYRFPSSSFLIFRITQQ